MAEYKFPTEVIDLPSEAKLQVIGGNVVFFENQSIPNVTEGQPNTNSAHSLPPPV